MTPGGMQRLDAKPVQIEGCEPKQSNDRLINPHFSVGQENGTQNGTMVNGTKD